MIKRQPIFFLLALVLMAALVGATNTVISGFNSPYGVASSPNHNYLYVTNSGNNTVSIVNKTTNTILGTITGFNYPSGVAFTPNGTFAYVTNLGNNELIRIDTATNTITGITGGFNLPYYLSISPDGKYAYVTNQGNDTVSIVNLTIQPKLSIPTITPSSATFDLNQNVFLTALWSGGSPSYVGNWLIFRGSNVVYIAHHPAINNLSNILSLPASTLGIGNYKANISVSDRSNPTQTANSVKATFSINSALNTGNPFPPSPSINAGQSITLTANPSGGTAPYSYQWYASLNSTCNAGSVSIATGASVTVAPSANSYYCYTVTDNATPPVTITSNSDLVTVNQGTGQPGNTGGPGGTGGAGGPQKPTIVTMISNQTNILVNLLAEQTALNITSPTASKNEFIVLGIAVPNMFNLTLEGARLNFTTNFIAPTEAGVTINNQNYLLSPDNSVVINQTQNHNYTLSVALSNISLVPILHTIALSVKADLNPINITSQNFTGDIPANQTLSVRNLTASSTLPSLPIGYQKQLIQNVSVHQKLDTPNNKINATVSTKISYNCSIPFYEEVPLILSNYSWAQISSFTVKPQECIVTFSFGSDPILALTKHFSSVTNTTTIPHTTTIPPSRTTSISTITTTVLSQNQFPPTNIPLLYSIMALIILVIIIVLVLLLSRKRKTDKDEQEMQKAKGKQEKEKHTEKNKQEKEKQEEKKRKNVKSTQPKTKEEASKSSTRSIKKRKNTNKSSTKRTKKKGKTKGKSGTKRTGKKNTKRRRKK